MLKVKGAVIIGDLRGFMFSVILSLTSYVLVMHNSESRCLTCFTLRVIFAL